MCIRDRTEGVEALLVNRGHRRVIRMRPASAFVKNRGAILGSKSSPGATRRTTNPRIVHRTAQGIQSAHRSFIGLRRPFIGLRRSSKARTDCPTSAQSVHRTARTARGTTQIVHRSAQAVQRSRRAFIALRRPFVALRRPFIELRKPSNVRAERPTLARGVHCTARAVQNRFLEAQTALLCPNVPLLS